MAYLDILNIDPSSFIGATILGKNYSPADEENLFNDHALSYVNDSGPFAWEHYIIETDRGNLDIRFLCNDGGYSFGGGELFITPKTK